MPLLRANANPGTATWVDNYADNLTISGNITSTGDNAFSGTNAGIRTVQGTTETADSTLDDAGSPYALTVADSGGTFLIDADGGLVAVTIPAAAAGNRGVCYRFVCSTNVAATTATVASGAADIIGTIVDATPTVDPMSAETTITFEDAAIIGDSLEVHSTGSQWLARAVSGAANGITAA
jgi:hypothetical protein